MDALRLLSRSTNIKNIKNGTTLGSQVPSEGPQITENKASPSRKRKRQDDTDSEAGKVSLNDRVKSDEEIRKYQNVHKIRVVDFRHFREDHTSVTRKTHKESARIYRQPLIAFSQLESDYRLSSQLATNIAEQGYIEPTVVQCATMPLLLDEGHLEPDILTIAPTGSGKTLAFLVPLIQKLHRVGETGKDRQNGIKALILAPTKELVSQIVSEGLKLSHNMGVTIQTVHKKLRFPDANFELANSDDSEAELSNSHPSTAKSKKPLLPDILVSTPLSLVHLISDQNTKSLAQVRNLILDEADVLLDPLFREQTMEIWSACTNPSLRVSLWSATIGASIEELACKTIDNRHKASNSESPQHPLLRVIIGLKDSSLPTINHRLIYAATEAGKLIGFRQLLHPSRPPPQTKPHKSTSSTSTEQSTPLRPPFLVFTQTIERATALHKELEYDIPSTAGGPSRIAVLHSSLSDHKRADVMARFRKGQIWILITTDLLSRGVDFRGVNGVVNYDIPTTSAGYVHRAGRTGRAGREGGVCVTFYTKDDIKYVKAIANVIAASEKIKSNTSGNPASVENKGSSDRTTDSWSGLQKWVLDALPDLSKNERKELKERGVESRRGIKLSDDAKERKSKRKARIGTQSGYEKRIENNRKGAVQASQRKHIMGEGRRDNAQEDEWGGISD